MTQRLIYGKTVKIEGDILAFDGTTFMDPYDDTGLIAPIAFRDTAFAAPILSVTGAQVGAAVQFRLTRNENYVRVENAIPTGSGSITPTGTSMTVTIPDPFRPSGNINLLIPMFNVTTSLPVSTICTLTTAGLLTFTGLTGGSTYTFRYGFALPVYLA